MASLLDAGSPVAARARSCMELLEKLVKVSDDSQCVSKAVSVDLHGRFKLWAGNMGALHSFKIKTSLDFRLRENPKVSNRISELLDELIECVEEACSIASNERENRTGILDSEFGHDPGTELERGEDEEEMSEIEEIFKSIIDIIGNLFRFSAIIRDNSKRDRYAKAEAAAATRHPLIDQFDISHVEHKFPALQSKDKDWLAVRLGKAITQRRKYLWYCREHHEKTQMGPQTIIQTVEHPSIPTLPRKFDLDTRTVLSRPMSTLAPTQASTLLLSTEITPDPELEEDSQSQTSYATSIGQDEEGTKLQVLPLETVSKGSPIFECPYCWQIQTIKTQNSWRKHVLSDLKSYVCTFQDCDLTMFPDYHTWFLHELKDHRKQWKCHFCTKAKVFISSGEYASHLKHHHASSFIEEQLPSLLELSEQSLLDRLPPDCPFCEDWEGKLRKINPHIAPWEEFFVSPSQFKHHVGKHMEQLALFAIPRERSDDKDLDSDKSEGHSINSLRNIGKLSSRALSSHALSSFADSVQSKHNHDVSVADYEKQPLNIEYSRKNYDHQVVTPPPESSEVTSTVDDYMYYIAKLGVDTELFSALDERRRGQVVLNAISEVAKSDYNQFKSKLELEIAIGMLDPGPKIWTGTKFLPRFVQSAQVPGEGLYYFHDDGNHYKAFIEDEGVNPYWGVTEAGEPRKRLEIACLTCREKEIACDPDYPCCVQCEHFGRVCKFRGNPSSQIDQQLNPEIPSNLNLLLGLGIFEKERAELAVKKTVGLQAALNWLSDNRNKSMEEISGPQQITNSESPKNDLHTQHLTIENFKTYLEENHYPIHMYGFFKGNNDGGSVTVIELYSTVQQKGGYDVVTNDSRWSEIAMDLFKCDEAGAETFGVDLKAYYNYYCLPFDPGQEYPEKKEETAHDFMGIDEDLGDGSTLGDTGVSHSAGPKSSEKTVHVKKLPDSSNEPESLSEEIIRIQKLLPRVTWDHVDVEDNVVKVSMNGPWAEEDRIIPFQVTMVFPRKYPLSTSPTTFTIRSKDVSSRLKSKDLQKLTSIYTSREQNFLEPVLRYLVGSISWEEATAFYDDVQDDTDLSTAQETPSPKKKLPDTTSFALSCRSLRIGSWNPVKGVAMDLTLLSNMTNSKIAYEIIDEDVGYMIEYPFSLVKLLMFAPINSNPEVEQSEKVGYIVLQLHRSPYFSRKNGSDWQACDDFTTDQQASKSLLHYIEGNERDFIQFCLHSRVPHTDNHSSSGQQIRTLENNSQDKNNEIANLVAEFNELREATDKKDTTTEKMVKVYELQDPDWIQLGSGNFAWRLQYNQITGNMEMCVMVSSNDHRELFEACITTPFAFKKEQDTAVNWKDPSSNAEFTISFPEAESCTHAWNRINGVQERLLQRELDRSPQSAKELVSTEVEYGASSHPPYRLHPPLAVSEQKTEVFEMHDDWESRGTAVCFAAMCSADSTSQPLEPRIIVESDKSPGIILFVAVVRPGRDFATFEESDIILWTDPITEVQLALHFEKTDGYEPIWDFIVKFQKQILPEVAETDELEVKHDERDSPGEIDSNRRLEVLVLEVRDDGKQLTRGTGYFDLLGQQSCVRITSMLHSDAILFEEKCGKPNQFRKQQDLTITWSDSEGKVKFHLEFTHAKDRFVAWDLLTRFQGLRKGNTESENQQGPAEALDTSEGKSVAKNVTFELHFGSLQSSARSSIRVQIVPDDTTDTIVSAIENYDSRYKSLISSKKLNFKDKHTKTLIPHYENLQNNGVVDVYIDDE
ncbi:hypothetical protein HYFRA_00006759 [Hymenoscyphus fraxineus]|uniref:Uncharacterized protein n=1 Tax=Hymenoscyphus fraxineus TaxID=746836 RepID=A0A9N9KQN0_9HELO|nr:hypothetical protein HYFRA_00006759 [Hymenoscyphus fraxineus]